MDELPTNTKILLALVEAGQRNFVASPHGFKAVVDLTAKYFGCEKLTGGFLGGGFLPKKSPAVNEAFFIAGGAEKKLDTPYDVQFCELNAASINEIIEKTTQGMLKNVVSDRMLQGIAQSFGSVTRFEAEWLFKFTKSKTDASFVFHGKHGDCLVEMMEQTCELYVCFEFLRTRAFFSVAMPYRAKGYRMIATLPVEENTDIAEALARYPEEYEKHANFEDFKGSSCRIRFPKLSLESTISNAWPMLVEKCGLPSDFTSHIPGAACFQKAILKADEDKTVAAQVTVLYKRAVRRPPELETEWIGDRPFIYSITDGQNILFCGLFDPSKQKKRDREDETVESQPKKQK